MTRRYAEHDAGGFPWRDLFQGKGLDVGSGDDPLTCARPFNLPDGAGDDLTDFFPPGETFNFIHGSQVLEHMIDPVRAMQSWITMTKAGGYIIATVPDFELYEHEVWPSKWNAGHRSTWSLSLTESPAGDMHCKLPEWLNQFLNRVAPIEIMLCRLVDTNFDYHANPDLDQTLDPEKGVEAFIEFVLRKPL